LTPDETFNSVVYDECNETRRTISSRIRPCGQQDGYRRFTDKPKVDIHDSSPEFDTDWQTEDLVAKSQASGGRPEREALPAENLRSLRPNDASNRNGAFKIF